MEISKFNKFLLAIFTIGIIVWIGGSIVRTAIVYDIFEPVDRTLKFRYWVDEKIALMTVRHFAIGSLYTEISFAIVLISTILLFPTFVKYFRNEGWLFMSFILLTLAFISELVLMYFDIRLGLYVFFNQNISYFSNEIQTFFFKRFTTYNFLIVYNWLAVFTIIFFVVFKPLRKKHEKQATIR
ncbi:MAG: hypothetical protein ACPLX7_03075 [Candidatus Kapaibacteriota bacterium]|jgi:hypothetical protein